MYFWYGSILIRIKLMVMNRIMVIVKDFKILCGIVFCGLMVLVELVVIELNLM